MKLTSRLFGYLNRVFSQDPEPFLALRLTYAGAMTWQVADEVLSTSIPDAPERNLSVNLSQFTLRTLTAYLAGQAGYTVLYIDPGLGDLSARVLLDGAGDISTSNGDHLFGYGSLLWGVVDAMAKEVSDAQAQAAQLPEQMVLGSAEGVWLDLLASYYGVARMTGEVDAQFAPRVLAQILRARGNGKAIETALEALTGQPATVLDVTEYVQVVTSHNGAITRDGSHTRSSTSAPVYGLFDVATAYDLLNGGDPTAYHDLLFALVETLRDAGTHMRALQLSNGQLNDNAAPPRADYLTPFAGVQALSDAPTAPTEIAASQSLALTSHLTETAAPADDSTDGLTFKTSALHNGARTRNGHLIRATGYLVTESLDGTRLISAVKLLQAEAAFGNPGSSQLWAAL